MPGFFAAILASEKNALFDGFKRKEIPKSLEYTVKWKMEQSNGKCDKSNLADHYNAYILTMTWLCCLQRIGTISRNGGKVERKAFSTIEFECLLKQTDGRKK